MKRIKIYIRLTMTQNRCSDPTVISIEGELSNKIVSIMIFNKHLHGPSFHN